MVNSQQIYQFKKNWTEIKLNSMWQDRNTFTALHYTLSLIGLSKLISRGIPQAALTAVYNNIIPQVTGQLK